MNKSITEYKFTHQEKCVLEPVCTVVLSKACR